MNGEFGDRVPDYVARLEHALERFLPPAEQHPAELHQAMRYACLNGGKHLRPLLVYATGEFLDISPAILDPAATAVEMIHAYSLAHDDLPAMDDDDLRRGIPTVHKAFDEATAILAGDALQALAFHILVKDRDAGVEPAQRLKMVELLAQAAGSRGMAGGQAMDLAATGKDLSPAELEDMHIHKTGMLIRASVLLACHCRPALDAKMLEALDHYGKCIGLAFQIRDDILDEEADTTTLGKQQGADRERNKPTYPSVLGMAEAKLRANTLIEDALAAIEPWPTQSEGLRWLAQYVIGRGY